MDCINDEMFCRDDMKSGLSKETKQGQRGTLFFFHGFQGQGTTERGPYPFGTF
jgi:hypothetical protein